MGWHGEPLLFAAKPGRSELRDVFGCRASWRARLKYHVAESARSFEIVLNCMSSGNRWNKSQASAIDVDCFNGGRDKQARLVCQLPHHAESTSRKGLGNHSHHSPDLMTSDTSCSIPSYPSFIFFQMLERAFAVTSSSRKWAVQVPHIS